MKRQLGRLSESGERSTDKGIVQEAAIEVSSIMRAIVPDPTRSMRRFSSDNQSKCNDALTSRKELYICNTYVRNPISL